MKTCALILVLSLLQGFHAGAQGIGLESGSRIVLNADDLNSRPLSLSPVFNVHNRFNLSVFNRPVADQAQKPNMLLRKKVAVPDYVYKNLGMLMRGVNTSAAHQSNRSVEFHFDSRVIDDNAIRYDRYAPLDDFSNPAWSFGESFRLYPYFQSSVIYSPAYWIRPPLH